MAFVADTFSQAHLNLTKSDQKLTWELLFGQPLAQFEIISGPSHLPEQFDNF
jgi:hypothetical protein